MIACLKNRGKGLSLEDPDDVKKLEDISKHLGGYIKSKQKREEEEKKVIEIKEYIAKKKGNTFFYV